MSQLFRVSDIFLVFILVYLSYHIYEEVFFSFVYMYYKIDHYTRLIKGDVLDGVGE